MKIPVFQSQARATSEAPGASIQARMNASPFIEAALRQGEVFGEAMKQIGSYALVRAKAEAEVQYNEAMLAAEGEMRTLAEGLKETARLGDVINEKGTGSWQVQTKDMRERLADGLSSRSMSDAFNARFNQQELSLRFQLRDAIETRVNARAAAAAKARQDSLVDQLSNPNTDPALAVMLLTSQDAELRASVANGIMIPEAREAVNSAMVNKIVDNVTAGFVGSDPAKAIQLSKALEYQAQVDAGSMTAEKAAEDAGLGPDAAYTLSVLRMARPDVAIKALAEAVTTANKLDGAADEARTEKAAAFKTQTDNAYNSTFGVDPNAPADINLSFRLLQASPEAMNLSGLDASQPITGKQYLDAITNFLDKNNAMTPEQRKALNTHRNPNVSGPFATETNSAVYSALYSKQVSGTLTMAELNSNQGDLSIADWKAMAEGIQTEANQSLQLVDNAVAAKFNFNKFTAPSDDQAKESQAAYAYVTSQLLMDFNASRAAGKPMTSTELTARSKELVDERMVSYRATIQTQLSDYLMGQAQTNSQAGLPNFPVGNERAALENWYNSLPEPTLTQTSVYTNLLTQINYYTKLIQGQ